MIIHIPSLYLGSIYHEITKIIARVSSFNLQDFIEYILKNNIIYSVPLFIQFCEHFSSVIGQKSI
jgi:hypothetical protein